MPTPNPYITRIAPSPTGDMHICHYGCGNKGIYYNKRKKVWCCSKSTQSCPEVKKRNRERQKSISVRTKIEQTMMAKYGVKHHMHLQETKDKIKATSLERYGTENPAQSTQIKEKAKKTNLKRYGVEWTTQSDMINSKREKTFRKKYGGRPASNRKIQEKMKKTCKNRWGVENGGQTKKSIEKASRPKSISTKRRMKQTWLNKSKKEIDLMIKKRIKTTGYSSPFCLSENRSNQSISTKETNWLDSLNNPNILRQYYIKDIGVVDGYDPLENTVYLFHGDFWHGNPNKFNPNDINPRTKTTYGFLFEQTKKYENKLKKLKYNVVAIWEGDYASNIQY